MSNTFVELWTEARVQDIASDAPRSITIGPFGSRLKAELYVADGFPVIRGQDIGPGKGLLEDNLVYVPEAVAESLSGCIVSEGDLIFPHRGAIGQVGIVGQRQFLLSSSMMKLTCNRTVIDPGFLFYYFRGPGRDELLTRASTVGTPGIGQPLKSLRGIPIRYPGLPQQQAIAEVLGALDDKIAANTKLSRIADDYVRARYEEVERTSKESMAVSKLATARRDTVDPSSTVSGTLYVGLEHIPRRSMWLGDSGYAADVTSQKSSFERDDILFGKLRPYFHKVVAAPHAGVSSTDILVLTATIADLNGFVLAALASDSVVASVTAMSEGTRMPRTSWKDLSAVEVPWPGEARAKEFSAEMIVLRSAVEGLLEENKTLAATRDALLPQLMSGKLRVRNAETAVEAVV